MPKANFEKISREVDKETDPRELKQLYHTTMNYFGMKFSQLQKQADEPSNELSQTIEKINGHGA